MALIPGATSSILPPWPSKCQLPVGEVADGTGGNWPIVRSVCPSDSTRRRRQAKRSLWQPSLVPAPPGDKLARRHELATHDRRDNTPIPDPPVRHQKSLTPRGAADKIHDGGRDACPHEPLAVPTSVSPLTVSGLAHPGSGGSLLHSFVSPKRQRLCRYDKVELYNKAVVIH